MKRLLILLGIFFLAALWVWHLSSAVDSTSTQQEFFTIEQGSSVSQIASQLHEKKLIRSPLLFKAYARIQGIASSIQAGTFSLKKSLSLPEVLEILHRGGASEVLVTIPEGFTVADIDALLVARGIGQPGEIVDCAFRCDFGSFDFLPATSAGDTSLGYGSRLEGYLFPETYSVNPSQFVPKFFLERMLGEFRKRVVIGHADAIAQHEYTLEEIVTMASLIEEESRTEAERKVIAGILWKRLENRIVLGVDATTRYETRKKSEPLLKTELEADSLYNTRRKLGLPPSPIASPSESSVIAALEPTESHYWYYLHGSDGTIRYAVTAEQHTQNKIRYLR